MHGTNQTECLKLPAKNPCYRYVQYALFPNLMGVSPMQIDSSLFNGWRYSSKCYQHIDELACYIFYPKCDPVSEQTIPPMPRNVPAMLKLHVVSFEWVNCNDLPSSRGNVPCTYERVFCDDPPYVEHATVETHPPWGTFFLHATAEYTCNKEYKMEGNKYVTCTYSGNWSTRPQCLFIKPRPNPLFIVLPILLLLLANSAFQ